jgi:hypothetical protein
MADSTAPVTVYRKDYSLYPYELKQVMRLKHGHYVVTTIRACITMGCGEGGGVEGVALLTAPARCTPVGGPEV